MAAIFISHSTQDKQYVRELQAALKRQGLAVWLDDPELRAGDNLEPEIKAAIEAARDVIIVYSLNALNSEWVRREAEHALQIRAERDDGYHVVPVLIDGVKPTAIKAQFGAEPLCVKSETGPAGVSKAMPAILKNLPVWGASLYRAVDGAFPIRRRPASLRRAPLLMNKIVSALTQPVGRVRDS